MIFIVYGWPNICDCSLLLLYVQIHERYKASLWKQCRLEHKSPNSLILIGFLILRRSICCTNTSQCTQHCWTITFETFEIFFSNEKKIMTQSRCSSRAVRQGNLQKGLHAMQLGIVVYNLGTYAKSYNSHLDGRGCDLLLKLWVAGNV